MQIRVITVAAMAAWTLGLEAQETPPAPPSVQPAPPPAPPVLTYSGKPLTVPFQCTADDMQAAGLDCSEQDPCPVYLELSAIESSAIRVFAAGNIHTPSATLYSILLGSEDNGHTWREMYERVRGAALDHLQFSGADAGWASGQLVYPLPQDPFLLQTSDGGKTWRQHQIFDEQGFGAIQQFWFEDAKNGSLIIDHGAGAEGDRYELHESHDSGDSWTVKESSVKPLKLRRAAPAGNPDWRIRADATSKSYHLEHREGGRWVSIGAFSVSLGACKPPQ
ncbi:MAG TPA: hypothetical protein VMJ75_12785 [Candidatus Acidoferrales bacterium]|nr:hypothetical protein [Candidatus Acidoferrales bacterium]